MLFRFAIAVALVVLVALAGAVLEKSNLALRRRISHQQFQLDELHARQRQLTGEAQRLGAPARWLEPLEDGRLALQRPTIVAGTLRVPSRTVLNDTPSRNGTRSVPATHEEPRRR